MKRLAQNTEFWWKAVSGYEALETQHLTYTENYSWRESYVTKELR